MLLPAEAAALGPASVAYVCATAAPVPAPPACDGNPSSNGLGAAAASSAAAAAYDVGACADAATSAVRDALTGALVVAGTAVAVDAAAAAAATLRCAAARQTSSTSRAGTGSCLQIAAKFRPLSFSAGIGSTQ